MAEKDKKNVEILKTEYRPDEKSIAGLRQFIAKNYMTQIKNFFGDEDRALKFMSSIVADVQRNPKLLECTQLSLANSYITMAQLGFMPSGVSGESYVLPYKNSKKLANGSWETVMEAQFQLGYQGLVTLFYKAGVEKITSALVRKNDKTSFVNGEMRHEIDLTMSSTERGEVIGAYVTVKYMGHDNVKYMNAKDIIEHGRKFSKSFDLTGKHSPWNPENDPEGWMYVKTVLKQHAKLLPKNETINRAIAADNEDSIIADRKRLDGAKEESKQLSMGNFLNDENSKQAEEGADAPHQDDVAESIQVGDEEGGKK